MKLTQKETINVETELELPYYCKVGDYTYYSIVNEENPTVVKACIIDEYAMLSTGRAAAIGFETGTPITQHEFNEAVKLALSTISVNTNLLLEANPLPEPTI